MKKVLHDQLFELSSKANSVEIIAEKVQVLADELCQDYFDKVDVTAERPEGAALLVLDGYSRYATFANILYDYAFQVSKEATALQKEISRLSMEKAATA